MTDDKPENETGNDISFSDTEDHFQLNNEITDLVDDLQRKESREDRETSSPSDDSIYPSAESSESSLDNHSLTKNKITESKIEDILEEDEPEEKRGVDKEDEMEEEEKEEDEDRNELEDLAQPSGDSRARGDYFGECD